MIRIIEHRWFSQAARGLGRLAACESRFGSLPDPRRPIAGAASPSLWRDDRGFLTAVNLAALLLFVTLFAMLFNVCYVTIQKVRLQNTADSIAYSGAVWQARGMNAITATNHVMGEMMSLVIIHEAVGGEALDKGWPMIEATRSEDEELDRAYQAARGLGARTPAYKTVRQHEGVHAQATLLDSKKVLKKLLAQVYWLKAIAKIMQMWPPTRPAGIALERAMDALEMLIWNEYKILNALHKIARSLVPLKKLVRDHLLPNAKRYTRDVVRAVPELAQDTAEQIARNKGMTGTMFPVKPRLPVVEDPLVKGASGGSSGHGGGGLAGSSRYSGAFGNGGPSRDVQYTQLARATFPWVNYHRKPILDFMGPVLPLSQAKKFYFRHSNAYFLDLCDKLQRSSRHDLGQYVLKGYRPPNKGYAPWTRNAAQADRLFCVLGLAHRRPPIVLGFLPAHQDGMMAYAQAMVYNANTQRPSGVSQRQADVGWDTLNWMPAAQGRRPPFEFTPRPVPAEFPEIQVNWQARLTPATGTRLRDLRGAGRGGWAGGRLPGQFATMARKLLPNVPSSLRTH